MQGLFTPLGRTYHKTVSINFVSSTDEQHLPMHLHVIHRALTLSVERSQRRLVFHGSSMLWRDGRVPGDNSTMQTVYLQRERERERERQRDRETQTERERCSTASGSRSISCRRPPNWHLSAWHIFWKIYARDPHIKDFFFTALAVILNHFLFRDPQFDMH